jgi:hypothetical protein
MLPFFNIAVENATKVAIHLVVLSDTLFCDSLPSSYMAR